MQTYTKPSIVGNESINGILPLVGLSAAKLAVVGVAAGLGLGSLMKGNGNFDSSHSKILSARKNFALN